MADNHDLMVALEASTNAVIEALSHDRKIWFTVEMVAALRMPNTWPQSLQEDFTFTARP